MARRQDELSEADEAMALFLARGTTRRKSAKICNFRKGPPPTGQGDADVRARLAVGCREDSDGSPGECHRRAQARAGGVRPCEQAVRRWRHCRIRAWLAKMGAGPLEWWDRGRARASGRSGKARREKIGIRAGRANSSAAASVAATAGRPRGWARGGGPGGHISS